jgi:hypothetical protein
MSTLTLTDAASTPVNRAFIGVLSNPDLCVWKDYTTNGGFPIGASVASLSVKENGSGTIRVSGKLVIAVMETISGDTDLGFDPVPTKAFEELGSFDLVFPARTSLQNRKDLKTMLIDFLSDAIVTAAVENAVRPS